MVWFVVVTVQSLPFSYRLLFSQSHFFIKSETVTCPEFHQTYGISSIYLLYVIYAPLWERATYFLSLFAFSCKSTIPHSIMIVKIVKITKVSSQPSFHHYHCLRPMVQEGGGINPLGRQPCSRRDSNPARPSDSDSPYVNWAKRSHFQYL
jgi:hypothetical protein